MTVSPAPIHLRARSAQPGSTRIRVRASSRVLPAAISSRWSPSRRYSRGTVRALPGAPPGRRQQQHRCPAGQGEPPTGPAVQPRRWASARRA
jgi:hypothetical protein